MRIDILTMPESEVFIVRKGDEDDQEQGQEYVIQPQDRDGYGDEYNPGQGALFQFFRPGQRDVPSVKMTGSQRSFPVPGNPATASL